MNTFTRRLHILAILALFLAACNFSDPRVQTDQKAVSSFVAYEDLLGRSLTDAVVVGFIGDHNCSSAGSFQLCNESGIALWIDSAQIVDTVYLYLNNADGFVPYKGKLPLGLKYYDIMEAVEYKLKKQGVGQDGLPDEGSSPDHLHYWAVYEQAGVTIIYNSPFADGDATIYAILVNT